MATNNIEANGYSFTNNGYSFFVFQNHQLSQDTLNAIHQFVPGWYPTATVGYMTICIQNSASQVGVYQVERIMNLFTILPKFMHIVDHLDAHMTGILGFIHELIKRSAPVQVANEIGFRIAFYKPPELAQAHFSNWIGGWHFIKNSSQTICGGTLPQQLPEYTVRWTFGDNYQIKTTAGNTVSQGNWNWNK